MSSRTRIDAPPGTGDPTWHPHSPIASIMDVRVPRIAPDATAEAVSERMGFSPRALVVDGDGKPLGLVERTHIAAGGTARQMMSGLPVSLHGSVPVSVAASLMAASGTDRIAVVSDEGGVIGLLTAHDLLDWVAREAGHRVPRERNGNGIPLRTREEAV